MEILRGRVYAEAQSRKIPESIYEHFRENFKIKQTDKVLELGVGNGEFISFLSKFTTHVHGIDINPEAVNTAKLKNPNAQILVATAENLPYADETFDRVVSVHTLEHIHDLGQALREMYRVTKNPGFHFHIVPFDYVSKVEGSILDALKVYPKNPLKAFLLANKIHQRSFTDKSISDMANVVTPFGIFWGKFSVFKLPVRFNTSMLFYKSSV